MKATVIHGNLNSTGGERNLALAVIRCLKVLGFRVQLVAAQPPNLAALRKTYNEEIPTIDDIASLLPFKLDFLGLYQKILALVPALTIRETDIIFNTNGMLMPDRKLNAPQFTYMHFPPFLLGSGDYASRYQTSFFWKAYFKPYSLMTKFILDRAIDRAQILTNSMFSLNAIRQVWSSAKVSILQPPVNLSRFENVRQSKREQDKVLVVARFSPEKQLETVLEIAKISRELRFEIVGSLIPSNYEYYNAFRRKIIKAGLEHRVTLRPNADARQLVDAMSTSSTYLHTMRGEHFGTAIVEAMAAGLIPVVPDYGGCSEMVPSPFQYESVEEASGLLERATMLSESEREFFKARASLYSISAFRERLRTTIEQAGVRIVESPISVR